MHYRAWLIPDVAPRLVRDAHVRNRFYVLQLDVGLTQIPMPRGGLIFGCPIEMAIEEVEGAFAVDRVGAVEEFDFSALGYL